MICDIFPASAKEFDSASHSDVTTLVCEWGAIITSFSVRSIDGDVLFNKGLHTDDRMTSFCGV
jgi:hypothetical protein